MNESRATTVNAIIFYAEIPEFQAIKVFIVNIYVNPESKVLI